MAYICKQIAPASAANFLVLIGAELINMGWLLRDKFIPFTVGKNPGPSVGDQILGNTSGATATIGDIVVTGGSWVGNNAAGFFGLTNVVGQFQAETLKNNTTGLTPQATTTGVLHSVYSSNSETGNNLTEYVDLFILASTITLLAYGWWNNATHTGNTKQFGAGIVGMTYAAGGTYVIVGNKDLVLVRRVAAANDIIFGHFPKRFHPTPFATLTAPCVAGNGIVLALDNNTNFVMNQTYWIIGNAGEGKWRGNVTGIGIGTITVDNLGSALNAGAKIGAAPSVFGATITVGQFYPTWERDATGTGDPAAGQAIWNVANLIYSIAICDPDDSLGLAPAPYNTPGIYVLQPWILVHNNAAPSFASGVSDSIFLSPPLNVAENTFGVTANGAPIDTGTASAGSGNFTLECLGKLWGINVHANKIVIIASGTGLGQTRKIASNTADTLTVGTQWITNPNITSIFFIVDAAYRVPTTLTNIAYREEI